MSSQQEDCRDVAGSSCLSDEILQLIELLQISKEEGQLLMTLAEQAVSKLESDQEAIQWLDREVRSRHPNLWWLIAQRTALVRQA